MSAGRTSDAERLLRRAILLAPAAVPAHVDLISLLSRLGRAEEALALLGTALTRQPDCVWALSLKAAVLETEHRTDEALEVHRALLAQASHAAVPWTNYGHALKTVGNLADAVAAYRRALDLDPASGVAWWGLANLRTVRLGAEDVARMEQALAHVRDDLNRTQLHFALGKALADLDRFESSFRHYERANAIRAGLIRYDPASLSGLVDQMQTRFTASLVERHAGQGCDAPDPIFIVGMPRSGSTLVEQILASHPMIEGLGELPELDRIAALIGGAGASRPAWPETVVGLGPDGLRALGEDYLAATRRYRRTDRPFFTDKMPANWRYVGLIRLILPHAKIVDVRRQPLACCFSNFTTYFNLRTNFPSSLKDLGRYCADYVRAMDHFDAVLPGTVRRVHHERLVEDAEAEVRRLLDDLGLPFDAACLRFHENMRAVHTPSAQQVRQPINREGLERWRRYEAWLRPLEAALARGVSG